MNSIFQREHMLLKTKGYSIAEWALMLGVVIGVIALGQEVIKNSLERKALLTAQYLVWDSLEEEPFEEDLEDYDSSRTKTWSRDAKKAIQLEKHSGEVKSVMDPAASQRISKSVNISVAGDMVGEGDKAPGVADMEQHFLDKVPVEYKELP
ncbi:MAG: hypothetical protein FJZ10_05305 [Candidatus Omnitrophica bacterium]|nr:hypothetical protein [Candidatus Omnitrophota bacterium]